MADGWHLDPASLLPVLDDEAAFRTAHARDPAVDALVALFAGRPHEAEALLQQLLDQAPDDPRLTALYADARRDQGHVDEAETLYRQLIAAERDPLRRATFVQHLGKTLYAAERYSDAAACFADALAVRRGMDAGEDLVSSSEEALAAARRRAG